MLKTGRHFVPETEPAAQAEAGHVGLTDKDGLSLAQSGDFTGQHGAVAVDVETHAFHPHPVGRLQAVGQGDPQRGIVPVHGQHRVKRRLSCQSGASFLGRHGQVRSDLQPGGGGQWKVTVGGLDGATERGVQRAHLHFGGRGQRAEQFAVLVFPQGMSPEREVVERDFGSGSQTQRAFAHGEVHAAPEQAGQAGPTGYAAELYPARAVLAAHAQGAVVDAHAYAGQKRGQGGQRTGAVGPGGLSGRGSGKARQRPYDVGHRAFQFHAVQNGLEAEQRKPAQFGPACVGPEVDVGHRAGSEADAPDDYLGPRHQRKIHLAYDAAHTQGGF